MSTKRAHGLDLLRALAVTMVLLCHFDGGGKERIFAGLGEYGWMGVDLFFVLSGYLIGSQLFRPIARGERLDLWRFFVRRVLRTLPNFLVILFIYACFQSWRERPTLPPLWKYLTFTQNLGLDRHSAGAFSHAWSLCVEEQFYLLLPLMALFAIPRWGERQLRAIFIGTFLGGILLRASLWEWVVAPARFSSQFSSFYDEVLYYPTYARLDGLLIGVALALIRVFRPEVWQRLIARGPLALGIGAVLVVAGASLNRVSLLGAALIYPLVALGFGALLLASLSPVMSRRQIPGVGLVATLSYGIYLLEKLVLHWNQKLLPQLGIPPFGYWGFFATCAMCVGLAAVLHLTVERPCLRWRERLIS